jgi:hypothetical protein
VKIKEMLQVLLSGEDFSDHSTGKEDGSSPLHAEGCNFCEAWRQALWIIGPDCPGFVDFESGDDVLICGRAPGKVVGTRTQIDVRLGDSHHVGTFAAEFVEHAPAPEFYADRDGDMWKVVGDGKLSLCVLGTWRPHSGKAARVAPMDEVEDHHGPLTPAVKP